MTDEKWQAAFKEYLINKGYKEYTPSGNKSTVYDYVLRVDRICKEPECENGISWEELSRRISKILPLYDQYGEKAYFGARSHNAYINALKQFEIFSKNMC